MSRERFSSFSERFSDRLASRVDRRTVTKALLGGALVLPQLQQNMDLVEHTTYPEEHPDISRHLVMIDFAPDSSSQSFKQWFFYPDEALLSRELQDKYLGPIERTLVGGAYTGLHWLGTQSEQAEQLLSFAGLDGTMEELFLRNNPHFAIASSALQDVGPHGQGVDHVMWQTIQSITKDGHGITPRIYPIQATMDIRFDEDELGNYTLIAEADPTKISDALIHYPRQDIVNFSWQAGDVRVHVHNKVFINGQIQELPTPTIIKSGAYREEVAIGNLRQLFSICDAFREKLFFAATGNLGDDIRAARVYLTERGEWPENVLMVGEWLQESEDDYGKPNFRTFGSDIYVINKAGDKTFAHGTSFSTAILSGTGSFLRSASYSTDEIKELYLTTLSEERQYRTSDNPNPFTGELEATRLYREDRLHSLLSHHGG